MTCIQYSILISSTQLGELGDICTKILKSAYKIFLLSQKVPYPPSQSVLSPRKETTILIYHHYS